MSNKKVDISKDGYNSMLDKAMQNIQEERDLALDRYRFQDAQMSSPEDFVLQGKDVVAYLKLASERTNAIITLAKEIKDIVYMNELKNAQENSSSKGISDEERKQMEEVIKGMKGNKKNIDEIKDGI